MNVVLDTTIFGQIIEVIMSNEAFNKKIKHIEVSPTEMYELLQQAGAITSTDKHFAAFSNENMLHFAGKSQVYAIQGEDVELPTSIWVRSTKIVVVE